MSRPRIAASSYSNTAPLIWSFLHGTGRERAEIVTDKAPARSAELLAQGGIDAALVPVIEYQRIADARLFPAVCVGARARVRSVCLVTKGAHLADAKTVALDVSSRTSVALTKIIFREFLGKEPIYRTAEPDLSRMLAESDCALLIGDPALSIGDWGLGIGDSTAESQKLKTKSQKPKAENQFRKFDLVEMWRAFTGCGFVFAMWMARAGNLEAARALDFAAARDEGLERVEEIISHYEKKIALSRDELREYLTRNISYTVDENMQRGLELYFRLAHRHGLTEACAPLRFIGD